MSLIYLIAGEASGDALGARLMASLRARRNDLSFAGVGGPRMAAAGLDSLFPMQDLALFGLMEVIPRLLKLRRRLGETRDEIARLRPDVVVTIDVPGFALRLLRAIAPLGIPRVHYVAPQVWAWREQRIQGYPGLWDKLLCLLPFEPEIFARHGLPASFVGHPVLQSGADQGDGLRFRTRHNLPGAARIVVLMPGSRRSEVARLLPIFGKALDLLGPRISGLHPVVPVSTAVAEAVRKAAGSWPVPPVVVNGLEDKHDAFAAAEAALTKSGTSTLELALAGVPMAVTYRVNPLTALIARRLVHVPHVSIVNLLAGREVIPELLQEECTPQRLADALYRLLAYPPEARDQRAAFSDIVARLHPPAGLPSDAAAEEVLALLPPGVAK